MVNCKWLIVNELGYKQPATCKLLNHAPNY